jgi:hypothetical protein
LLDRLWYLYSQEPPLKHRDLKGENIIVTLDMGTQEQSLPTLEAVRSLSLAATTHNKYTKMYEALEQVHARRGRVPATTLETDVFQMGCCLTWIEGAI